MRLLVVAAYPPELAAFADVPRSPPRVKPSSSVPTPSWMSSPGDAFPTFVTQAVGIGLVEAAVGAARAIARHEPDFVLQVGTCGFYRQRPAPRISVGQAVVLGVTALVDPAVTLGTASTLPSISRLLAADGEFLGDVSQSAPSSPAMTKLLALPAVRVATTASLTTSDEVADRLGEQWDVENLEAAAVATACRAAAVRFGAIFGVANRVGSTGRKEWLDNREPAERAAGSAARRLVDRWLM